MNKELLAIFEYLEREKGIARGVIIAAIEEALLTAARKSVKGQLHIAVHISPKTGDIVVTAEKEVVEQVVIPTEEIQLKAAMEILPSAQIGDWIEVPCTPEDFGRVAAQVARQIIAQKLKSAERDVIYEGYRHRINELISGTVKRIVRGATLIVDLGKVEGILPERFYPKTETYQVGDRIQSLLFEVRDTEGGGAEVVLTRSHPDFVRQLFLQEVPELQDGTVTIEKIVRHAGYRTKLAVRSSETKVDPVGACVGVRGTRVKNIIRELNNEKIDILSDTDDPMELLVRALAPIVILKMSVNDDQTVVTIVVDDDNYPAALGKRGMNARLNGELVGVDLQIQKMSDYQQIAAIQRIQLATAEDVTLDEPLRVEGISSLVVDGLISAGFDTPRKVLVSTPQELTKIPGISLEMATKILNEICKKRGLKIG